MAELQDLRRFSVVGAMPLSFNRASTRVIPLNKPRMQASCEPASAIRRDALHLEFLSVGRAPFHLASPRLHRAQSYAE